MTTRPRIAYVDHSYHEKTRSTWFLVELLRTVADVDVFWDETWRSGSDVFVDVARNRYDAIVLFQNYDRFDYEAFRRRGLTNVTIIPMYDQSGTVPLSCWFRHRHAKVINFSATLHARVQWLGLRSLYVQYYQPLPASLPPLPGGGTARLAESGLAFHWQRRLDVPWKTAIRLLGDQPVKHIHIHGAADPGQSFETPSEDESLRLGITVSTWFDTKDEYLRLVRDCDVFFAPRVAEGIGQSFIEALGMGKCVVAPDRPTMNEYITDGVDGLLYDPADPRPLDFTRIDDIRIAARQRYEAGLQRWNRQSAEQVIRFVLDETPPTSPSRLFMALIRAHDLGWRVIGRLARLPVLKQILEPLLQ